MIKQKRLPFFFGWEKKDCIFFVTFDDHPGSRLDFNHLWWIHPRYFWNAFNF